MAGSKKSKKEVYTKKEVYRINQVLRIIAKLGKKSADGGARYAAIIKEAARIGMDKATARKTLEKLERSGDVFSPKKTKQWDTPLRTFGKNNITYDYSADLNDPKFAFLFQKEPVPRCSFCRMSLDNELFFYKIGKAVTRKSVLAHGDVQIKPETRLICRLCWHERRLDSI